MDGERERGREAGSEGGREGGMDEGEVLVRFTFLCVGGMWWQLLCAETTGAKK